MFNVSAVERSEIKLMGQVEIARRLGYSRQWTASLVGRRTFPEPLATLAIGPVWLEADVEAWIEENRPHINEPPGDETADE